MSAVVPVPFTAKERPGLHVSGSCATSSWIFPLILSSSFCLATQKQPLTSDNTKELSEDSVNFSGLSELFHNFRSLGLVMIVF